MNTTVTLNQHVYLDQKNYPQGTGVFSELLSEIALAGKIISREVNKAGIAEIYGFTGDINVQGEEVQKIDEWAQKTFENILGHTGHLCAMASEEKEDIIRISDNKQLGNYVMAFDPIDGCSNIDVNVNIGSIFSIHKRVTKQGHGTLKDLLQPGFKQVAAGYIVYGSSTMFVYTTGHGVHGFTLDPSIGEFLLTHKDIKSPKTCKNFSTNETYYHEWPNGIKKYIDNIKKGGQSSARYIGSLIADFHRNLLDGGIFLYPRTKKRSNGKLRLLYEASPLAFIIEQAGGYASNGGKNILEITPTELHQRTPLIIGNKEEVKKIEKLLQS